jgi:hypothetical protein
LRDSSSLASSSTGNEIGTAVLQGKRISWIHGLTRPRWAQMDGVIMTPSTKVGIAGIVLGLILLAILPWWAAVGIIIIAAAIPVGGYLALDKSQRRRIRAIRERQR